MSWSSREATHETRRASFLLNVSRILSIIFRSSLSASFGVSPFGSRRSGPCLLRWLCSRLSFHFASLFLLSLLLPRGMPSVELRSCTAPQGWWHRLERSANLLVQLLEVTHCCLLLCFPLCFVLGLSPLRALLSLEGVARLRCGQCLGITS